MARAARVSNLVRVGVQLPWFEASGPHGMSIRRPLGGTAGILERFFRHLQAGSEFGAYVKAPEQWQVTRSEALPTAALLVHKVLLALLEAGGQEARAEAGARGHTPHPSRAVRLSSRLSEAQAVPAPPAPSVCQDESGVWKGATEPPHPHPRPAASPQKPSLAGQPLPGSAVRPHGRGSRGGLEEAWGSRGRARAPYAPRCFSKSAGDSSGSALEELGDHMRRRAAKASASLLGPGAGEETQDSSSEALGNSRPEERAEAPDRAQGKNIPGLSAEFGGSSSLEPGLELSWRPGSDGEKGAAAREGGERTPGAFEGQGREGGPSAMSESGPVPTPGAPDLPGEQDPGTRALPRQGWQEPSAASREGEAPALEPQDHRRKAAQLGQAILGGGLDLLGPQAREPAREAEAGGVPVEAQLSLRVGIVGAPNAGKSVLTNALVGSKVSIVSRKTNTTRTEVLGVATRGATQLLLYDTPGATPDVRGQPLKAVNQKMVSRAWQLTEACEVLLLLVDAERHIRRPDARVKWLVEKVGSELPAGQRRVACLNKVDLVRDKRQLLPLAEWLQTFHAFDRVFMTSGLKGSGMQQLQNYLLAQAVVRPWEEDPGQPSGLSPQEVALETVREALLDRLHEELPYTVEQRPVAWQTLQDGSLRIEQLLLVASETQRAMVVGQRGQTVRQIGINARKQLEDLFKRNVHLILNVKVKQKQ